MRAKIDAMEKQDPVFWWRPCSDGAYEGPIHNSSIERVRKQSGAWSPLYLAPGAQPAPSFADAYQGAMEDVAIWKKRALEAEDLNRKFVAEINGPAYMGEPAQPAPSVPDDMIEQAVTRFLSWKLPKDFHPDGGVVFIPTKGRGYDSPHWPCGTNLLNAQQALDMLRHVLAAAPEAKP